MLSKINRQPATSSIRDSCIPGSRDNFSIWCVSVYVAEPRLRSAPLSSSAESPEKCSARCVSSTPFLDALQVFVCCQPAPYGIPRTIYPRARATRELFDVCHNASIAHARNSFNSRWRPKFAASLVSSRADAGSYLRVSAFMIPCDPPSTSNRRGSNKRTRPDVKQTGSTRDEGDARRDHHTRATIYRHRRNLRLSSLFASGFAVFRASAVLRFGLLRAFGPWCLGVEERRG